jgi:hypothetical protein
LSKIDSLLVLTARFVQYLGLDPDVDKALMWIAVEGLSAPLPDNWSEHVDENGNLYASSIVAVM